MVVEAEPGGAELNPVDKYLAQGSNTMWSSGSLTNDDRGLLEVAACRLIGTPYGWPDILAVALSQQRLGREIDPYLPMEKQPWWVQRLSDTDCLICSQLIDYAYFLCGLHLFDDGRPFGLVSPGDLGKLITG